ncbi:MAG: CpXC domain-containing protein [Caldilineaceae bacterium]|nr:CpXC domain-containing protein [Caldilineaceae bacterium]
MSGILLPGQDKKPQSSEGEAQSSGLVLPKGFGSHKKENVAPKPVEPVKTAGEQSTPPAAEPPSPAAPAAQPRQGAGRPQIDFKFPPSGAQIQCPNCQTPYTAAVFNIVDLGANPELRSALLGGQINLGVCPSCNAAVQLGAPMLIHDPENKFLAAFVPQGAQTNDMDAQRVIGQLTQMLMRTIPAEQRKGYLLTPQQFFDWNRLIEKLWGFEGVTPEMLRKRSEQSQLLQRLLPLLGDEKALAIVLERSGHLVDREFFAMLEQAVMGLMGQGQREAASGLMALRQKLMESTEAGRELKKRQDKVRGLLDEITEETTREQLLDMITKAWSEEDGEDVVGALAMSAAPMIDYQFLMLLADRIEKTSDEQARTKLEDLRQLLMEMQAQQQQSRQAVMQQMQQVLQEVLQATDTQAALDEYADFIDENFLALLASNIQSAQQKNATAAVNRLQKVYQLALAMLEESLPAEIRLLQQIVQAPDINAARKLVQENRSLINNDFKEALTAVEKQFRDNGQTEPANRLKTLRGQIAMMG